MLLVLFLVLPGFGLALREILRSPWGHVIGFWSDLRRWSAALFGVEVSTGRPSSGALLVLAR